MKNDPRTLGLYGFLHWGRGAYHYASFTPLPKLSSKPSLGPFQIHQMEMETNKELGVSSTVMEEKLKTWSPLWQHVNDIFETTLPMDEDLTIFEG